MAFWVANGLSGCRMAIDLVKISVKKNMRMDFIRQGLKLTL